MGSAACVPADRARGLREIAVAAVPDASGPRPVLPSACGLQLYLRMPGTTAFPVDLLPDATVGELKRAAHDAGGPAPAQQTLSVGGIELPEDGVLLSDTAVSMEAVVDVGRRVPVLRSAVCAGAFHGVALLESGAVVGWGFEPHWSPVPDFGGKAVTSVHAGLGFSGAVAGGELVLWAESAPLYAADVRSRVGCSPLASVSASTHRKLLVIVDADGALHQCGPAPVCVPTDALCRVAAASCGRNFVAVLTLSGRVVVCTEQGHETVDIGGGCAVAVSVGGGHGAALLSDGRLRCFGSDHFNDFSGVERARDVVACGCGHGFTVAVTRSGCVRWWGSLGRSRFVTPRCGCTAVSAGERFFVAVTADRRLVTGGQNYVRQCEAPADAVLADV
eukprot:TRINITY_DN20364_c0_g1_i1.p1 TRINITY_DN20364_c0_g1~~TRINITY_DN20364_c0_g1_i1.p1  ORF type:complete len:408 (+),score=133.64 TRINITY_DN20364_c0_g1_i1:56-1225(+)